MYGWTNPNHTRNGWVNPTYNNPVYVHLSKGGASMISQVQRELGFIHVPKQNDTGLENTYTDIDVHCTLKLLLCFFLPNWSSHNKGRWGSSPHIDCTFGSQLHMFTNYGKHARNHTVNLGCHMFFRNSAPFNKWPVNIPSILQHVTCLIHANWLWLVQSSRALQVQVGRAEVNKSRRCSWADMAWCSDRGIYIYIQCVLYIYTYNMLYVRYLYAALCSHMWGPTPTPTLHGLDLGVKRKHFIHRRCVTVCLDFKKGLATTVEISADESLGPMKSYS